eukprot:Sdes_comp20792_c0_seq1m17025
MDESEYEILSLEEALSCTTVEDSVDATEWKEENKFTKQEYETCLKVLSLLESDKETTLSSKYRQVRIQCCKIASLNDARYFQGKGKDAYETQKRLKREKKTREARLKELDRKHIESLALRTGRIETKNKLLKHSSPAQPCRAIASQPETSPCDAPEEPLNSASCLNRVLNFPRSCYLCKQYFVHLHFFYDQLCETCAQLSYQKRLQTADLKGKIVVLTGARVKIGYQCGLKLLRCGALVIATTRFPIDAARRYAQEADFEAWRENLHIYGLDLRDLMAVNRFAHMINQKYPPVDGIVNNAAQTVRRPIVYYQHLLQHELMDRKLLPEKIAHLFHGDVHQLDPLSPPFVSHPTCDTQAPLLPSTPNLHAIHNLAQVVSRMQQPTCAPLMSQIPLDEEDEKYARNEIQRAETFPEGEYDADEQQLDLRKKNSWTMKINEISTPELVEVHCVNALAPFVLNSILLEKMIAHADAAQYRFIINVSAMEGKFYRHKTPTHPHTNMAKAASNMMTRTSAQDLVRFNIYMNSVDTGWITDENPLDKCAHNIVHNNFSTPIDEIDAMARILDAPLCAYNGGQKVFGQFLKDFAPTEW